MEIIAEIGQNHNGDMGLACELIHAAKENGANAAKFQVYDSHTLFSSENNEWYEYNCKTALSYEQVQRLAEECHKAGIEFLASVFDVERINWLEEVGVKRYKIASRSVYDKTLIQAITRTGKPIIISLGMWNNDKFPDIVTDAPVYFLYCVAKYPAPLDEINLSHVDFQRYAGFSDHTLGLTASMAAFSRGAKLIEKHFTLDKNMYGPDHIGSMTPTELMQLDKFRRELMLCL